jgi:hypothetical protein
MKLVPRGYEAILTDPRDHLGMFNILVLVGCGDPRLLGEPHQSRFFANDAVRFAHHILQFFQPVIPVGQASSPSIKLDGQDAHPTKT